MNLTGIEWTDYTWNPVTGCKHDCEYCYARKISNRFNRSFEPQIHEKRLKEPYSAGVVSRRPIKIFVCSMADLFGGWVPDEWIEKVLEVVRDNPDKIFQFLTKNPKRYHEFDFPKNAWLGITATNQKQYREALSVNIGLYSNWKKSNICFVSFEPLLNEIDPNASCPPDWFIIGSQTNPNIQPKREWVDKIIRFADRRDIPYFVKKNLTEISLMDIRHDFPEGIK
jgi:protein gp37